MTVLGITVLAAVAGLIAYGGFDLGGSITAVIFLGILSTGTCAYAFKGYLERGE